MKWGTHALTVHLKMMEIRLFKKKNITCMKNQTPCKCDIFEPLMNVKKDIANNFREKKLKISATRRTLQSGMTLSQQPSIEAVGTQLIDNQLYNVHVWATLSVDLGADVLVFYCIDIVSFFTIIAIHWYSRTIWFHANEQ